MSGCPTSSTMPSFWAAAVVSVRLLRDHRESERRRVRLQRREHLLRGVGLATSSAVLAGMEHGLAVFDGEARVDRRFDRGPEQWRERRDDRGIVDADRQRVAVRDGAEPRPDHRRIDQFRLGADRDRQRVMSERVGLVGNPLRVGVGELRRQRPVVRRVLRSPCSRTLAARPPAARLRVDRDRCRVLPYPERPGRFRLWQLRSTVRLDRCARFPARCGRRRP